VGCVLTARGVLLWWKTVLRCRSEHVLPCWSGDSVWVRVRNMDARLVWACFLVPVASLLDL
jgi:hypothetical protein